MKTNKTVVLRESDIRKMKKDITHDVTKTAIYMFLAWLKDAEYIDNDPEILIAEYKRLEAWCDAIDEHLISLRDIKKIIEDGTGASIKVR